MGSADLLTGRHSWAEETVGMLWVWGKGVEGEFDHSCRCVKFSRISQNNFENLGICICNSNVERADRWIPTVGQPMG